MNTLDILNQFKTTIAFKQLQNLLKLDSKQPIFLDGVSQSGTTFIAAAAYTHFVSPILLLYATEEESLLAKNDIENILLGEPINYIPDSFQKALCYSREHAFKNQERTEALNILLKSKARIHISYAAAMCEWVIEQKDLTNQSVQMDRGMQLNMDFLLEFLQENNFVREEFVHEPGQFSVRGGIIDIYSYAHPLPFRIQLDDDVIFKIKKFDPVTQLSDTEIEFFTLIPNVRETQQLATSLFSYLPKNTVIYCKDYEIMLQEIKQSHTTNLVQAVKSKDLGGTELPLPSQVWMNHKEFAKNVNQFTQVHWGPNKPTHCTQTVAFVQKPQILINKDFKLFANYINQLQKAGFTALVFAQNPKQLERLDAILADIGCQTSFTPMYLGLSSGFIDEQAKIAVITEHQLFGKAFLPKSRKRYSSNSALTIRELKNLQPGDFITHIDFGIGKFSGLQTMEMNGQMQEVLRIIYKDNDLLYVSVSSLHKVAKFSGKDGTAPNLHKLGSGQWEKQKNKAKSRVKDIARELIQLYAQRKLQKGFAFSPDTYLQLELEASFFYEDTPDQAKAIDAIKKDMQETMPMDRLVCGDVGFGKTEVALRAAFKAVCDSKQVAVLVPTTILAQQHYRTFKARFNGFPVNVDYINRFKTAKDQKATLAKLAIGKTDILIGTHKIISKDVKFKDLGLLIIDEEQKFGVGAKDKLKEIKINVDTLTLTATPIPRTLQFSLMGARDLSIINTPPPNRLPVHTELHLFNREIIAQAIQFEVNRGGQVFLVHSRVRDINEMKHMVETICPGVKATIAHGQMGAEELENNMMRFIDGEYDVLVATTIIESGLDIPNANTIIINNAHMFGLSDLHQMRGRVGRSNVKAYCYLLTPGLSGLPQDAKKRLQAIEEYSDLGSGFQVAMRDLDIRGAGNLLGGEQSGFISEMGFDMYHKILDQAIAELKAETNEDAPDMIEIKSRDCQVEIDSETLISSIYVTSTAERIALYQELSAVQNKKELEQFEKEMEDRFGEIPTSALRLFKSMELKWIGMELGLEKIVLKTGMLKLYFPQNQNAAIFKSDFFIKLIQHVASNPTQFSMKQTPKSLILSLLRVTQLSQAIDTIMDFKNTIVNS